MPDYAREQVQKNAAWAERFRNAPTSLAQRSRYQAAIDAGTEADKTIAAERFGQQLLRDKATRDVYFKSQAAERANARLDQGAFRLSLDERKLNEAIDQHSVENQIKQNMADIQKAKLQAAQAKALLDSQNAKTIAEHNAAALRDMTELYKTTPGTPQFASRAVDILGRYPMMDKGIRQSLLGDAKITNDPEALVATAEMAKQNGLTMKTIHQDAHGNHTIDFAAPTPVKTVDPFTHLSKQYHDASTKYDSLFDSTGDLRSGYSQEEADFWKQQKDQAFQGLKTLSPGPQPQGAGESTMVRAGDQPDQTNQPIPSLADTDESGIPIPSGDQPPTRPSLNDIFGGGGQ